MKNSKWIGLLLMLVLVFTLVPSAFAADTVKPFVDVTTDQYFADPVSWAVENDITAGTSKDAFSPNKACQRAHAVTFLYRYYHMAQPAYVLMNIPYADFYAADGVAKVDAVSSSTLNKTRTAGLAGGSYHKDPGGTDISGVIYPVYVKDVSLLDGLKEVKDSDSVTITVTNRGQTSESTFTGKEALFENEDYAYYMLDEEPSAYKTMTKDAEGKLSVLSYDVNATLLKNPGAVTASFADANTVVLSGLPADIQNPVATVMNQVGRGETATVYADNVAVKDGKIALTTPAVEGQNYVITVVSANYGDVSCTVALGS